MNVQDRRQFMQFAIAASAGTLAGLPTLHAAEKPKLKKAVKFGMIKIDGSVEEKFKLIKKLGFLGVEIDSPSGLDLAEAKKAKESTGIKIHGVVDSVHWQDTLSSPDEAVRAKGLKALIGAMEDTAFVGADTTLLVPGVVNKEVSYDQCWERSTAEVKKALPKAEKLGVKIAIEVVWNNFITKPEQLVEYVDQFKSPFVGAYFDASNMLKYGVPAATWIRTLGKRMLKLDFKGYRLDDAKTMKGDWVAIGEGTEDWPEVLKACGEVGYTSWATAEVQGGGEKRLQEISQRMDKILELV